MDRSRPYWKVSTVCDSGCVVGQLELNGARRGCQLTMPSPLGGWTLPSDMASCSLCGRYVVQDSNQQISQKVGECGRGSYGSGKETEEAPNALGLRSSISNNRVDGV